MPKERRVPHSTCNPYRASPYPHRTDKLRTAQDMKEWEEARCPICMEHPHNAVLLECSSHNKACRPYICNTSQRHSNCLDQFYKSFGTSSTEQQQHRTSQGEAPNLACPLCRGDITGWVVIEPARKFMNAKTRSCSCEGCDFVGTYEELRRHAWSEHPLARPREVDQERQLDWMRLQEEWEREDLMQFQDDWDMEDTPYPGLFLINNALQSIHARQSNNLSSTSGTRSDTMRNLRTRPLPMRTSRTRSDTVRNLRPLVIPERHDDDGTRSTRMPRASHDTRQSNNSSMLRPRPPPMRTSRTRSDTRRNLRPSRTRERHEDGTRSNHGLERQLAGTEGFKAEQFLDVNKEREATEACRN